MIKSLKICFGWAISLIGIIFMCVPGKCFEVWKPFNTLSDEINIIIVRCLVFVAIFIFCILLYVRRCKVNVNARNYLIQVEYGDILKKKDCKRVIAFDECFSIKVGNRPEDINPKSVCGQYLKNNPSLNIEELIKSTHLKPANGTSQYQNKVHYESGRVLLNGDDLLLAFAKLNQKGRATFTRDEYLKSLAVLWSEINTYYNQKDVCITILGGGTTDFGEWKPTQQELLDTIIQSYKLSKHKIKPSNKLRIICTREDVNINKIDGNI